MAAVCYRHPNRETGVSCSSCGRPICPDCMTPTPVGMRCPECSRERTKVRTVGTLRAVPAVTQALIIVNVVVWVAEIATSGTFVGSTGGTVIEKGALYGPSIVHDHQYWRLLTSGFLHEGLLHLAINMLSLWFVGQVLEPAIGRVNFAAVYLASLFTGSFGALLFQPHALTVGASGAIFGIFGALLIVARARGIPFWQSGLGPVLVLNLLFSISFRGISIGGHLGGLVGGLIAGWLVVELAERRRTPSLAFFGCVALAVASIAAAVAVAGGQGLTPTGIGFGG
jgi:membrane associated rhomboid family serine protease